MPISIIEVSTSIHNSGNTTPSTTLAATPQAGDLVIAVFSSSNHNTALTSVSGLGATWSAVGSQGSTSGYAHSVWKGTGANAAGVVSGVQNSSRVGVFRVFLIRGLTSTAAVVTLQAVASTGSPSRAAGPTVTASNGQLVLALVTAPTSATIASITNPGSGWTTDTLATTSGVVAAFNTLHIPATGIDTTHQITTDTVGGSVNVRYGMLVLGDVAASIPETTGSLGVSVGLSSAVSTVATAAGSLAVAVGLSGVAETVVPEGITTGSLGVAVSLTGQASTIATATGSLGVSVGMTGEAETVGAATTTTGSLGVSVGMTGVAEYVPVYHLGPWTADESRKTRLELVTSGTADYYPPLAAPQPGIERTIYRRSVTVPRLDTIPGVIKDTNGHLRIPDHIYDTLPTVTEELGVLRTLMAEGGDITFFRDGLTQPKSYRSSEPFGDSDAELELPQITSQELPNEVAHWSQNRANVEFVLAGTTDQQLNGTVTRLWSGHVISDDTGNDRGRPFRRLLCQGSLWTASHTVHQVPNRLEPTDIGTLIARALNAVPSRRFPPIVPVATGIPSRQRGSWNEYEMDYAQGLLATGWTTDGNQWTVAKKPGTRWQYEIRLKKTTPEHTITNGAPGVAVTLSRDLTQGRNVIYGHGVGPDGYAWMNTKYPNLRKDDAPAFPFTNPDAVITIGTTDADTDSGTGVSDWQRRVLELGHKVVVDGVFNSTDAAVCRVVQRHFGAQQDGIVGGQTWNATFDVGGNGGDLNGVIRLPLAADPRTQKYLYNADGSRKSTGPESDNPLYDPHQPIVSDNVDFGSGITKAEGIISAQQIIDRESDPGLTGTITITTDPREGSRLFIEAGDKITLVGYEGADPVLHVSDVTVDLQSLAVTLSVDEKARDAMTVAQIKQRDLESRPDPARKPGNADRRSRADMDQVVPFDGESEAGWIPRHAIHGGLWSVIRLPVSEMGQVAKLLVTAASPAARFALAFFGSPIQPAHLLKYVGDPLATSDPFGPNADILQDQFGFIEGFGQEGQAEGYFPGKEGTHSLTGRAEEHGFRYISRWSPWIWMATYSPTSTFISGRVFPDQVQ